jgi:hypothetical protein
VWLWTLPDRLLTRLCRTGLRKWGALRCHAAIARIRAESAAFDASVALVAAIQHWQDRYRARLDRRLGALSDPSTSEEF